MSHIQIGLIQGHGFNQIRVLGKNRPNLLRHFLIVGPIACDKDRMGTAFEGFSSRHGRMNTIFARLIVASGDDAPATS